MGPASILRRVSASIAHRHPAPMPPAGEQHHTAAPDGADRARVAREHKAAGKLRRKLEADLRVTNPPAGGPVRAPASRGDVTPHGGAALSPLQYQEHKHRYSRSSTHRSAEHSSPSPMGLRSNPFWSRSDDDDGGGGDGDDVSLTVPTKGTAASAATLGSETSSDNAGGPVVVVAYADCELVHPRPSRLSQQHVRSLIDKVNQDAVCRENDTSDVESFHTACDE